MWLRKFFVKKIRGSLMAWGFVLIGAGSFWDSNLENSLIFPISASNKRGTDLPAALQIRQPNENFSDEEIALKMNFSHTQANNPFTSIRKNSCHGNPLSPISKTFCGLNLFRNASIPDDGRARPLLTSKAIV